MRTIWGQRRGGTRPLKGSRLRSFAQLQDGLLCGQVFLEASVGQILVGSLLVETRNYEQMRVFATSVVS